MIQRHIKQTGDLSKFDYFNDSTDTLNYLEAEIQSTDDPKEKQRITEIRDRLKTQTDTWFNNRMI